MADNMAILRREPYSPYVNEVLYSLTGTDPKELDLLWPDLDLMTLT